jgi:succinoglycan biosynthesis protein ExoA
MSADNSIDNLSCSEAEPGEGRRLSVTVIMPIRNEAAFIERSLGSVIAQDYPGQLMEIIVVDGMSDDGTREIVRNLIDREQNKSRKGEVQEQASPGAEPFLILDNPSRIAPFAFNIGLKRAGGDVIVRVDGHCEIPPDYVSRCVDELIKSGADCAGGLIKTVGETLAAECIGVAQSSLFGVGGAAFRTGQTSPGLTDTLAFGAYRRSVFERHGTFDVEFVRNQDDEFNYRVLHAGGKIWLDPSIEAIYYSRGSLSGLWKQYFQYGFWKVRVLQKHPLQMRLRQFVPPVFVGLVLLSALAAPVLPAFAYLGLGLIALYAIALVAASVLTARRVGWHSVMIVPLAFVALHWGYGLGFLTGLLKSWNRWGTHTKTPSATVATPLDAKE